MKNPEGVAAPLEPTLDEQITEAIRYVYPDVTNLRTLMRIVAEKWAAAVSKNTTTKMERERDAAVVTLRAMCGDEHWQTIGRKFAESLADIEARESRILELEKEIAALRQELSDEINAPGRTDF